MKYCGSRHMGIHVKAITSNRGRFRCVLFRFSSLKKGELFTLFTGNAEIKSCFAHLFQLPSHVSNATGLRRYGNFQNRVIAFAHKWPTKLSTTDQMPRFLMEDSKNDLHGDEGAVESGRSRTRHDTTFVGKEQVDRECSVASRFLSSFLAMDFCEVRRKQSFFF